PARGRRREQRPDLLPPFRIDLRGRCRLTRRFSCRLARHTLEERPPGGRDDRVSEVGWPVDANHADLRTTARTTHGRPEGAPPLLGREWLQAGGQATRLDARI